LDFKRGKIYLDPEFRYPSSHIICDKLLLILNANHEPPDHLIVVPAKTNLIYKDIKHGCHPELGFFHIQKKIGFYRDETLIQLNCIIHLDCNWFIERIKNNIVKTYDDFIASQQEISCIMSCLKKSKDDVPEFYWEYL
jgi:hypothetical protein